MRSGLISFYISHTLCKINNLLIFKVYNIKMMIINQFCEEGEMPHEINDEGNFFC